MSVTAVNPILPGFYPDPSICGVEGDYYIVNSSFAYFPGLPVMHSRDLAHWEQIGNVCDRESQLPLKGCGHSEGLFAPTIRYHQGVYYVICTNISGGGNFIVTAEDPAGPWSEPYYIREADGIDPSLFFDEDGKCYYIGTHPNPAGCRYDGDWYIWIQELDLQEMKLVGERRDVWNGAMRDIIWPEGPHLYRRNGYYYILHAEGGTGPAHAVAVCRSRSIWGPYENNFCNPIITHRHLGKDCPVRYVGHGDLVETPGGEWYMVMLAVRPLEGYTTMGRETFLAKVVWEDDWPVVNPGAGMLTETVEINLPAWEAPKRSAGMPCSVPGAPGETAGARGGLSGDCTGYRVDADAEAESASESGAPGRTTSARGGLSGDCMRYRFDADMGEEAGAEKSGLAEGLPEGSAPGSHVPGDGAVADEVPGSRDRLGAEFLALRNPDPDMYHLERGKGLCLKFGKANLKERKSPSYLGLRQRSHRFQVSASLSLCGLEKGKKAGIALMQSNEYHLRTEVSDGAAEVILCENGQDRCLGRGAVSGDEVQLCLAVDGLRADVSVRNPDGEQTLVQDADIRCLSTEAAGGFVGCTVGMYAVDETEEETKERQGEMRAQDSRQAEGTMSSETSENADGACFRFIDFISIGK